MTNREWLQSCSITQLAKWICDNADCSYCNFFGLSCGLIDWLEDEHEAEYIENDKNNE